MTNQTAIDLQNEFEKWVLEYDGREARGDESDDDDNPRILELTERIMQLPGTSLEAMRAKAVCAYYWHEDGFGSLVDQRDASIRFGAAWDAGIAADLIIAAVDILAPDFKRAMTAFNKQGLERAAAEASEEAALRAAADHGECAR